MWRSAPCCRVSARTRSRMPSRAERNRRMRSRSSFSIATVSTLATPGSAERRGARGAFPLIHRSRISPRGARPERRRRVEAQDGAVVDDRKTLAKTIGLLHVVVVRMIVRPLRWSPARVSQSRRRAWGSRPVVGSSRRTPSGRASRPGDHHRCCNPPRVSAAWRRFSATCICPRRRSARRSDLGGAEAEIASVEREHLFHRQVTSSCALRDHRDAPLGLTPTLHHIMHRRGSGRWWASRAS